MIMFKYYIPLMYTYVTRYKTVFRFLSFLFFTCLPSFYIVVVNNNISFQLIVNYIVTFIVMYSAYEVGYLFNDIVTIQFEQNPTLRINKKYIDILPKHLENMLTVRFAAIVIGCFFLQNYVFNIDIFIVALLLLFITYSLHNFVRSRINIITMFLLVLLKNLILIIPFMNDEFYQIMIIVLFSIVFIRTYEFATKDRFKLLSPIKDIDFFRIKYYLIVLLFIFILYTTHFMPMKYLYIFLMFLVYRLFTYLLLKKQVLKRNK